MSQVAGHGKGLDSGDLEEKIDHVYKFKKKSTNVGLFLDQPMRTPSKWQRARLKGFCIFIMCRPSKGPIRG